MSDSQSLKEAQATALELAASLLVKEVDAPMASALRQPALQEALDDFDPNCSSYIATLETNAGLEACASDFCALFLVGKSTSPHAAAWVEGDVAALGADLATSVSRWMTQLDVELDDGPWGNLPPDHVALLCGLVSLALRSNNPSHHTLAQSICKQALAAVPTFATAVRTKTTNPLYRAATTLLEHIIQQLLEPTPS